MKSRVPILIVLATLSFVVACDKQVTIDKTLSQLRAEEQAVNDAIAAISAGDEGFVAYPELAVGKGVFKVANLENVKVGGKTLKYGDECVASPGRVVAVGVGKNDVVVGYSLKEKNKESEGVPYCPDGIYLFVDKFYFHRMKEAARARELTLRAEEQKNSERRDLAERVLRRLYDGFAPRM